MDDCVFCKIVRKEIPSAGVYENETIYAFLDINPTNPGHTLIVPREHYENIYTMPDDVLGALTSAAKTLAIAVKSAVGADGINLIMNNDPAAGQLVFHAHLHVVPRLQSDGFRHWPGKAYKPGEMESVAQKIKTVLG
jgi:histidine triad (HIT) family protein